MAATALRYDGATMSHETRTGAFVYDGSPAKFHEWEFRTMVKWRSSDEERRLQSLSTIIDGLRGEAARIAMDIGHEALLKADGSLIAAIRWRHNEARDENRSVCL